MLVRHFLRREGSRGDVVSENLQQESIATICRGMIDAERNRAGGTGSGVETSRGVRTTV